MTINRDSWIYLYVLYVESGANEHPKEERRPLMSAVPDLSQGHSPASKTPSRRSAQARWSSWPTMKIEKMRVI